MSSSTSISNKCFQAHAHISLIGFEHIKPMTKSGSVLFHLRVKSPGTSWISPTLQFSLSSFPSIHKVELVESMHRI